MEHFIYCLRIIENGLRKLARSSVFSTVWILVIWGILHYLTDNETVFNYLLIGAVVCLLNTIVTNLGIRKKKMVFKVSYTWVIMAGTVLVLYHAGFVAAAVFAAAVFLASPFFGATICEGIVGLSLLITLAWYIF